MQPDLARRRVEAAQVGRLGTITARGLPHLVPCCFVLVGDVVYTAVDAKPKSTLALRRIDNLLANPAACLLVDHYEDDWAALWWVRLDGIAHIVTSDQEVGTAKEALRRKYRQYDETAISGPVIALDIQSWRSWP